MPSSEVPRVRSSPDIASFVYDRASNNRATRARPHADALPIGVASKSEGPLQRGREADDVEGAGADGGETQEGAPTGGVGGQHDRHQASREEREG